MHSPLKLISEWLERQPEEVREHVAGISMISIFTFINRPVDTKANTHESLQKWLKEPTEAEYAELSKVFLTRDIFRFVFVDDLGSDSAWPAWIEKQRRHLKLAEGEGRFASIASHMRDALTDAPRRQKVFVEAGDDWRANVEPRLADRDIRAWYDQASEEGLRANAQELGRPGS